MLSINSYPDAQDAIAHAVELRGYRKDWSDEQFIVRQLAKLVEEIGEMASTCAAGSRSASKLLWDTATLGIQARQVFDMRAAWTGVSIQRDALIKELADAQVVLAVLADALGVNSMDIARAKANADTLRGVRKTQEVEVDVFDTLDQIETHHPRHAIGALACPHCGSQYRATTIDEEEDGSCAFCDKDWPLTFIDDLK